METQPGEANQTNPGVPQEHEAESPPPQPEHIMVCLSAAPSSAKVIRAAAKIASAMGGAFTALFVETPQSADGESEYLHSLRNNFQLAEQLGAQLVTVYGEDVPAQIAEYAALSRVTKVVLGRSAQTRRRFAAPSLVDRLTAHNPGLDIYIIPDVQHTRKRPFRGLRSAKLTPKNILLTLLVLTGSTLLGRGLVHFGFREANVMTIYILGALLSSLFTTGWLHALLYSVSSVLLYNYFFTTPRFSFDFQGTGGPITFLVMFAAAFIIGTLMERVQAQARQTAMKAYRTEVTLDTGHKLQQAEGEAAVLDETARQLYRLLEKPVVIYPISEGALQKPLCYAGEGGKVPECIDGPSGEAARWAYQHNEAAGAATRILSGAPCLYLPVRGGGEVLAVAGVEVDPSSPPGPFEKNLLEAMLGECGLSLEKERLIEAHKQSELQVEQEKLRATLLRMISHDLRAPLTGIYGNADMLVKSAGTMEQAQIDEMHKDIYDDAVWLKELVENVLSLARVGEQTVPLAFQPEMLEDLFAEVLRNTARSSVGHHIQAEVGEEFLMAKMDAQLIVHVLINLISNAVKYTPPGSHMAVAELLRTLLQMHRRHRRTQANFLLNALVNRLGNVIYGTFQPHSRLFTILVACRGVAVYTVILRQPVHLPKGFFITFWVNGIGLAAILLQQRKNT